MNKFCFAAFVGIFGLVPGWLHAQKIDSMMHVYAENFPQEKIYVQFDKANYNPGETIWYKAYLFSGTDPSLISKNFYTELSDAEGNVIQRKIAPLYESTASGSFDIPAGTKLNRLHFRAYTSWMLNFDTAFIFDKDIRLLNIIKDSIASAAASNRYFQFFPEGGDVIAGVENNIAFKATNQYGMPIPVKGVLKDASGKEVLEFASVHDGMGKFLITPDKNDSLTATWKDDLGIEHQTAFPTVKSNGVSLRALPARNKVFFSVSRPANNGNDYPRVIVIANMNQQMVYRAVVNLSENSMSGGSIPTDQFPSGVLQITVFNSDYLPLAERVVFINNNEFEFQSLISVSTKSLQKHARNVIVIDIPDTLKSNLSMSITDEEVDGKKPNDDNIISRLLLTGDIKGYVHDPYYYFSNQSDSTAGHLDLVMLTHGWRRFKWDQLARLKTPVIKYSDKDYLSLQAQVLGIDPTRIAPDESLNVLLRKKDSSTQMLVVPRLKGDKFGLSGLVFYDTARAYYMFNVNRKLSDQSAVVFTNGLVDGYKKIRTGNFVFKGWTAEDSAMLRRNRFVMEEYARVHAFDKAKTLEAVTVRARQKSLKEKLDEDYTTGLFSGGDAYTFDLINDPLAVSYMDIFSYLQGKVAGLQITNNSGPNGASLSWRGGTPSLYLNEMQVDANQMKTTSVADIAMVKVFRPGTSVGFGGGSGSIAVYTKKGGEGVTPPDFKGLERALVIGYSPIKEFYAPNYINNPELNDVVDLRTTIYWNPNILIDKNSSKTTIEFFNNDITRRLRVVLEGVNELGKLTRVEKIIQ